MHINQHIFSSLGAMINFDTSILVAAIVLIITVSGIVFFKEEKHAWRKQAPSLITTLGIFCTFVGITVGLLRFDPNNDASLNYLLSGLKLAFIPSAVAILISICFKWIYSKHNVVNQDADFLAKFEQNTNAVEKLAKAIELIDWQASYRENLEQNMEHSTRLLTILETSLADIIQSLANKKENLDEVEGDLEQIINNCKGTLVKVNNDLNVVTEKLNLKVRNLFDNIQQQDKTVTALAEVYNKFDNFNQSMHELGSFATEVGKQLKLAVHNEVKEMEISISKALKRTVSNTARPMQ